jgi:hypothetical protein
VSSSAKHAEQKVNDNCAKQAKAEDLGDDKRTK